MAQHNFKVLEMACCFLIQIGNGQFRWGLFQIGIVTSNGSKQNISHKEINARNWKESNRLATVTIFKLCFILIARRIPSPSKDLESQSSATCHWIYLMMSFMFSAVRSQKRTTGSRATWKTPQLLEMEIELIGPSSGNVSIMNLIVAHLEYRNIDPMLKSHKKDARTCLIIPWRFDMLWHVYNLSIYAYQIVESV